MPNQGKVLPRIDGRALHVAINRPERCNSIDSETNFALEEAISKFVGADIKAMDAAAKSGEACRIPPTGYGGLTSRLGLNKPAIAAVNGLAMGGGFEIAIAADIVVAVEHAPFGLSGPLRHSLRASRIRQQVDAQFHSHHRTDASHRYRQGPEPSSSPASWRASARYSYVRARFPPIIRWTPTTAAPIFWPCWRSNMDFRTEDST